ncbi:emp24/gp25L/p24 family/GOLD-domain-containing protein [Mycena rebaudengoi]|nr:emp24/gp25L/p24 family/GOLD-domain-containing protein [Mycena rebaudengoi]
MIQRLLFLWALLLGVACTNALHFYLDANEKRCFIEEIPTDTVVEVLQGHYRALEWSEAEKAYTEDPNLGIWVEVDEMESGHNVVKTKGPSDGRFTFTTHIRLYLDVVVGSTKPDVEHDRSHVSELAAKVRDLNQKLEDIRREQQYQREREADYRNLSESTNSRAVWYSLAQIVVLLATCTWQLRHLRRFFEDRKMR